MITINKKENMKKQNITYCREGNFSGEILETPSGNIIYVGDGAPADIVFRRYTSDYRTTADKKLFVTATRRRYSTLEAAAAAVIKARARATGADL